MERSSSKELATINTLLGFPSEDQGSLLEVIEDYFIYPSNSSVRDPEDEVSGYDDHIDVTLRQVHAC